MVPFDRRSALREKKICRPLEKKKKRAHKMMATKRSGTSKNARKLPSAHICDCMSEGDARKTVHDVSAAPSFRPWRKKKNVQTPEEEKCAS
mmetsp:Transcript_22489/g.42258  ORF Transcript_22489/g.42258 Transcript_22489/m.42258 type:complete len:91 (-) Transcript_22489:328-600(-)